MKVAVNMRLPNGAEKTLVYGAKDVAEAYAKAKADHPTWENVRASVSGEEASRYFERELKKYNIIYADPPWKYNNRGVQGACEKHHKTMSLPELERLPVGEIADANCALFLWATFPTLSDALRLIGAWGFAYKTVAFVWLKQNRKADSWFFGTGFWTRSNAEVCLLATKGHPKRVSAKVHQIIVSHIEQHSKKPDEARDRIVQLMGDLPRIELFARQSPDGWDVWGNEVECSVTL